MIFERLKSKVVSHLSYLIGAGTEAFVVDPQRDVQPYIDLAKKHGVNIKYIFETHRNEDYVIGSLELADKTGAGSYATRNDIAILWPPNGDPIVLAILSDRTEKDAEYHDKLIAEAAKQAVKALKATYK